jgi:hypothetical protein
VPNFGLRWVSGLGGELFKAMQKASVTPPIIAEDLGVTTLWDFICLALMSVADTAIILL